MVLQVNTIIKEHELSKPIMQIIVAMHNLRLSYFNLRGRSKYPLIIIKKDFITFVYRIYYLRNAN